MAAFRAPFFAIVDAQFWEKRDQNHDVGGKKLRAHQQSASVAEKNGEINCLRYPAEEMPTIWALVRQWKQNPTAFDGFFSAQLPRARERLTENSCFPVNICP